MFASSSTTVCTTTMSSGFSDSAKSLSFWRLVRTATASGLARFLEMVCEREVCLVLGLAIERLVGKLRHRSLRLLVGTQSCQPGGLDSPVSVIGTMGLKLTASTLVARCNLGELLRQVCDHRK
eukprot:m.288010 g.288010  ORF g.288010 m.288010 type:complete len:123 (+) comp27085_c0_seq16:602-970(+)